MSYRLCCGVFNASQITLPTCSNDLPASAQASSADHQLLSSECETEFTIDSQPQPSSSSSSSQPQPSSSSSSKTHKSRTQMDPSKPPNGKGKSFWSRFKKKKANGAAKSPSDPEDESCVCIGFNHLNNAVEGCLATGLREDGNTDEDGNRGEFSLEMALARLPLDDEASNSGDAWWNNGSTNLVVYHGSHGYPAVNYNAAAAEARETIPAPSCLATSVENSRTPGVISVPNCIVRQCTLPPSESGLPPQQATFTEFTQVEYMHCLVPDLDCIANSCFYWGVMDRYEAEQLLDNKPEGTFLLRDSAQEDFLFSVSFRRYGRSLHARIDQEKHQFSFDVHDSGVFRAPTVCQLVAHYKDPACCMFFEPMLSRPLIRNFPFSLKHLARVAACKHLNYDSVNLLPLPKQLMDYLKYYHYKHKVSARKLFTVVKSNGQTSRPLTLADLPIVRGPEHS